MSDPLYLQFGFAFAIATTVFAFLKGDEPERIGAGAAVMALFSVLLLREESSTIQWPLAAFDLLLAVVYGALAWKSRRLWPVWATAIQAVAVMSHSLLLADPPPSADALLALTRLLNLATLAVIAIGVVQAWRDRGRLAVD